MILVISSKYLSKLLFCKIDMVLSFGDRCCFLTRRLFSPKKRHFTIAVKFGYFKKWLTHDYGHQFQISFEPTFLYKRPRFCRLIMLFCQKEAFYSIKTTFQYSRKICIFLNVLTHDSRQKFQISFEPTFLICTRDLGFVV